MRHPDHLHDDNADKINALIDEAANSLAYDSPEKAASALQELAFMCSKAGKDGRAMFNHLRKLAIKQAEAKTNVIFIKEKLESAESKLRENRNGTIIIT